MTKSTTKEAVVQPTYEESPSIWETIKTVIHATSAVILSACRTAEKSVKLVENEVDNLDSEQAIRLAHNKAKRDHILNS